MQIKELIKRLKEVEKLEPNSTVCLVTEKSTYNFTGFAVHDNRDVKLYVTVGDYYNVTMEDKEA